MTKQYYVLSFLLSMCATWLSPSLLSQEKSGLSLSSSSGMLGVDINPSSSMLFQEDIQVTAFNFHHFIETDYARVSRTNLFDLIGNLDNIEPIGNPSEVNDGTTERQLIFDRDGGNKNIAIQGSMTWASVLLKKDNRTRVGAYIKSRYSGSGFNLPESIGYYEAAAINGGNEVSIPPFSVSGLSWTELGGHYAHTYNQNAYESAAIGINAKLILPHEGGRFSTENPIIYRRNGDTYEVDSLTISSGYNTYVTGQQDIVRFNGIGIGGDIGISYYNDSYSYGFSLIDVGIAYVPGSAESYKIRSDNTVVFDATPITDPEDLIEIFTEIDNQLEPQISELVESGGSYSLSLPTAISMQYRQRLNHLFSLGAQWVQGFPLLPGTIKRPASLTVSPLARIGDLEMSLPINLYNYESLRAGFSIKYRYLYFGSDYAASLVGRNPFSGTDIYFGLLWSPRPAKKKSLSECYRF